MSRKLNLRPDLHRCWLYGLGTAAAMALTGFGLAPLVSICVGLWLLGHVYKAIEAHSAR